MFRRIADIVLALKWPLLLGTVLLTLAMGYAIRRLQIDPTVDLLFNKKSPEYQYYRDFTLQYGSDSMIAVAMQTPDLFSMTALKRLKRITKAIAKHEEVERVLSL